LVFEVKTTPSKFLIKLSSRNAEWQLRPKVIINGYLIMKRTKKVILTLATLALMPAFQPSSVKADDYDTKPFSLRFQSALTRFSPFSDVAGTGGASVASRFSSSVNPASAAWDIKEKEPNSEKQLLKTATSPQYSRLSFSNGTEFDVFASSIFSPISDDDTLLGSIAGVDTDHGKTNDGLGFDLALIQSQLAWGHRDSDEWGYGASFNFAESVTNVDYLGTNVAHSSSHVFGTRAGLIYSPCSNLRFGQTLEFSASPGRNTVLDLQSGTEFSDRDSTYSYLYRSGVTYEYGNEKSAIYADYHGGVFENGEGNLVVNRFPVGIDHSIYKWLYVRGGAIIDALGYVTPSVGFGLYPKAVSIDVAFQQGYSPELTKDFGSARLYSIALSIPF